MRGLFHVFHLILLCYTIYIVTHRFLFPMGLKRLLFLWVSCITVILPLDTLVLSAQLCVYSASGNLNEVTVFRSVIYSLDVLLESPRLCIQPLKSFVPSFALYSVKIVFPTSVSITNCCLVFAKDFEAFGFHLSLELSIPEPKSTLSFGSTFAGLIYILSFDLMYPLHSQLFWQDNTGLNHLHYNLSCWGTVCSPL